MRIVNLVKLEKPDCLAYHSIARKGHINFLFFENGFNNPGFYTTYAPLIANLPHTAKSHTKNANKQRSNLLGIQPFYSIHYILK